MKRRKFIAQITNGTCAAVLGLMLVAFSPSSAKAQQPPRNGCVVVTKSEYDSAKNKNLLRTRFGNYLRTGRLLRRAYWYCT
jgi:hypothetical protein